MLNEGRGRNFKNAPQTGDFYFLFEDSKSCPMVLYEHKMTFGNSKG